MNIPLKKKSLEATDIAFAFLQGKVPEDTQVEESHVPHLTPDQAWTAIWFIQELHQALTDNIERCGVCGVLYDSNYEGMYREDTPPHHFCGFCTPEEDEE